MGDGARVRRKVVEGEEEGMGNGMQAMPLYGDELRRIDDKRQRFTDEGTTLER